MMRKDRRHKHSEWRELLWSKMLWRLNSRPKVTRSILEDEGGEARYEVGVCRGQLREVTDERCDQERRGDKVTKDNGEV